MPAFYNRSRPGLRHRRVVPKSEKEVLQITSCGTRPVKKTIGELAEPSPSFIEAFQRKRLVQ